MPNFINLLLMGVCVIFCLGLSHSNAAVYTVCLFTLYVFWRTCVYPFLLDIYLKCNMGSKVCVFSLLVDIAK